MASMISTPPSVSWAQDSARVYLTFNIECEKPDIRIEKKTVSFKGICAPDNILHEVVIDLYGDVEPEKSTQVNKGRYLEVILSKVITSAHFWPSLTIDKKKYHWLKVDFNRWKDDEESGDEFDCMHGHDMFSDKIGDFEDDMEKEGSTSSDEDVLPDLQ